MALTLRQRLVRFARKSPREQFRSLNCSLVQEGWKVAHSGNDRTTYIVGLLGTGRSYVAHLTAQNIGERSAYFREYIRIHPGPTSMIYSGHATICTASRGQVLPAVTSRMLEAVRLGIADLIFVYRHPIDSLLTNWVWWRVLDRDNITVSGISQVYKSTDELCADLEGNFPEFKAFAEQSPAPGIPLRVHRFLSFPQFVEETELYLQSSTLTLRLEDFMSDPVKEFSKIVEVMSVDLDLSQLQIAAPKSKAYGFLAVEQKVPRFRDFMNNLDARTKRRIEKMGYPLGA